MPEFPDDPHFSSLQVIEGQAFRHKIGVLGCGISTRGDGREMVEVEYHGVMLWQAPAGFYRPANAVPAALAEATEHVVATIDAAIAELQRHRERLTTQQHAAARSD